MPRASIRCKNLSMLKICFDLDLIATLQRYLPQLAITAQISLTSKFREDWILHNSLVMIATSFSSRRAMANKMGFSPIQHRDFSQIHLTFSQTLQQYPVRLQGPHRALRHPFRPRL